MAFASAGWITCDIYVRGYRQHMKIMEAVWPVNIWLVRARTVQGRAAGDVTVRLVALRDARLPAPFGVICR